MFKWLSRIAIGFVALKLAETYRRQSRATRTPMPNLPTTSPDKT